jgi:small-conductance mechanosensitive channel
VFDLLPGFFVLMALPFTLLKNKHLLNISYDVCEIYMAFITALMINGILLSIMDFYYARKNNARHPIKGLIQVFQVLTFFLCAIVIISIVINKSPAKLIAGLGAMATILMLVFKDSIVGFVSGVQLSMNNMLRPGDWITVPSANINGVVQDITINTVKVQNFDNTISTIPPSSLMNGSFQNWRGMSESDGRRVNKQLYLNMLTIDFCTEKLINTIKTALPLMADYEFDTANPPTNSQVYRAYIEKYLRSLPVVNTDLDIIISQQQMTCTGVPIQIYFFSRDKEWARYEKIQSDIFDHLIAVIPVFGLQLFQYPPETAVPS